MRGAIQAIVIVVLLATCSRLVFAAILRTREAARLLQCVNNLRQIGIAVACYEDTESHFPLAAMPNVDLPAERRLSWLVTIVPYVEADDTYSRMDRRKGWDADENRFAALFTFKPFVCPGYPEKPPVTALVPTHYIGISGVGDDAADLPSDDPRAGVFGYERSVCKDDLVRGDSQTAMVTETNAARGAWTAAGPPTVRGFDPTTSRFGGNHRSVCQVLFADATVRQVDARMSEADWARLVVLRSSADEE